MCVHILSKMGGDVNSFSQSHQKEHLGCINSYTLKYTSDIKYKGTELTPSEML